MQKNFKKIANSNIHGAAALVASFISVFSEKIAGELQRMERESEEMAQVISLLIEVHAAVLAGAVDEALVFHFGEKDLLARRIEFAKSFVCDFIEAAESDKMGDFLEKLKMEAEQYGI